MCISVYFIYKQVVLTHRYLEDMVGLFAHFNCAPLIPTNPITLRPLCASRRGAACPVVLLLVCVCIMASLLRVVAASCSTPLFSGVSFAKLQSGCTVKSSGLRFFRTHQALGRCASPGKTCTLKQQRCDKTLSVSVWRADFLDSVSQNAAI